ncbi:MAG: hypothetical protein ACK55I_36240, partial [bacterium]
HRHVLGHLHRDSVLELGLHALVDGVPEVLELRLQVLELALRVIDYLRGLLVDLDADLLNQIFDLLEALLGLALDDLDLPLDCLLDVMLIVSAQGGLVVQQVPQSLRPLSVLDLVDQ